MTTWVFTEVFIFFLSYVWFLITYDETFGPATLVIKWIILAVVLSWPVHWLANVWVVTQNEYKQSLVKEKESWYSNMSAKGCKRTGFVGVGGGRTTSGYIKPVWTCPDGQAYLEPTWIE